MATCALSRAPTPSSTSKAAIAAVVKDSPAEKAGLDFDMVITAIEVPQAQPSRYWFYIPAVLVVGLVVLLQRGRRGKIVAAPA